jgi:CubicO group peptidase (beta-lactamase class C family)
MAIRIVRWVVLALAVLVLGLGAWLFFLPPDLIRVGTGYTAKIVCSSHFVSGRDSAEVLRVDVQAPGHPLLGYIDVDLDEEGTVSARLLGIFGEGRAVLRQGLGCASFPSGAAADVLALPLEASEQVQDLWPVGNEIGAPVAAIQAIIDDDAMAGPDMRAIVVARGGSIVAERYGDGFGPETPLLGWSMTKTVTAAIIGTLVRDGRIDLEEAGLFPAWADDARAQITLADLMAMSSGLEFNEDYGDVTDVTRMLYLEQDMAAFAADKPLVAEPGTTFSYSSGTSVLLSRIWQDRFDDPAEALAWPGEALFRPLGMTSAVLEADAAGTYVGSSYLYATGRDWVRFGQFLLQDGEWAGEAVLPEGFVNWMTTPAPAAGGAYGNGQLWLNGPSAGTPEGEDPDQGFVLPDDAFWLLGHDGQSMVVAPSLDLVVLRLGLTPSRLGYKPQAMLQAIVDALPPRLQ